MKTKHIFSGDLFKAAVKVRKAEQAYEELFDFWASRIPPMLPETFWKHANRLRVIYNKKGRDCKSPCDATNTAAKEFLRQAWVGGMENFSEAVHFSISYWTYVEALKKSCEDIQLGWERPREGAEEDKDHHEDIESDEYRGNIEELLDSLPMAGEDVCGKLITKCYFKSPEEIDIAALEEDVRQAAPSSAERILHGCNQMAEVLHEEAAKYFRLFSIGYRDELFPKKPTGRG